MYCMVSCYGEPETTIFELHIEQELSKFDQNQNGPIEGNVWDKDVPEFSSPQVREQSVFTEALLF